jgi:hypothetical protein
MQKYAEIREPKNTVVFRERMFSVVLGVVKYHQPYELLQWTISGTILMYTLKHC